MKKEQNISTNEFMQIHNRYCNTIWAKKDPEKISNLFSRISSLSPSEKDLIFKLTDKFIYIDFTEIPASTDKSLTSLFNDNSQCKQIMIAPLKSPFINSKYIKTDSSGRLLSQKIKSSDFIYKLLSIAFNRNNYTFKGKIVFCDTPYDLKKAYVNDSIIALVDDFIGSGNTAVENVKSYLSFFEGESLHIKAEQFKVVVLAAMKDGINYISKHIKVKSYYNIIQNKGITEDIILNNNSNINLMNSIESKVLPGLNPEYSFGYKRSESLITIIEKSPNNTFPFYWYTNREIKQNAIFRREVL